MIKNLLPPSQISEFNILEEEKKKELNTRFSSLGDLKTIQFYGGASVYYYRYFSDGFNVYVSHKNSIGKRFYGLVEVNNELLFEYFNLDYLFKNNFLFDFDFLPKRYDEVIKAHVS